MKISREVQKIRGERLKAVLERYNLKPSDLTNFTKSDLETNPIKISSSEVTGWIKGGYDGKGYLTETKALDVISVIRDKFPNIPEIRLEYLLGLDDHMTKHEFIKEYIEQNDTDNNSLIAVLDSAVKEVCLREKIDLPVLDNIPELLLLQAQLKDYACSLMWNYIVHREHSSVWNYLDNLDK